jgi:NTE family protein
MADEKKTVLVLGGGAPHSPLMAGGLYALAEKDITFDIVYTSGAGALMGLAFLAPNGKTPQEALKDNVLAMGVSDAIYRIFPVGFKTWYKPGPFTRPLYRWGRLFKWNQNPYRLWSGFLGRREDALKRWYNAWSDFGIRLRGNAFERLYNDWVDFWLAVMNPTDLNYFSKGVCDSFPFLDEMVDLHKLKIFPGEFYMNAYNITDDRMDTFAKYEITPEHFRAALAMPFIYPPVEINGKLYIEGADHNPISFGNLYERADINSIKTIVIFDILGSLGKFLIREPKNLWDAYQISIMAPLVALAEKNLQEFERRVDEHESLKGREFQKIEEPLQRGRYYKQDDFSYHIFKFDIPKEQENHLLEWSYSNMSNVWSIGRRTVENLIPFLELDSRLSHQHRTPSPMISV